MLNKTSVMRALAAVIADAGSAYSYYGFLPYMPSQFWSRIGSAPGEEEIGERDQVEAPSSVQRNSNSENFPPDIRVIALLAQD